MSRQEVKNSIFAWLYNSKKHPNETALRKMFDKDKVLSEYWDGETVKTCFNREIPADKHHALNYIIQSTCADMVLEQVCKIRRLLAQKRSTIAFIVHDSVVLDLADEDRQELVRLVNEFSSTRLGEFMVNLHAGKNFGSMKELKIHG